VKRSVFLLQLVESALRLAQAGIAQRIERDLCPFSVEQGRDDVGMPRHISDQKTGGFEFLLVYALLVMDKYLLKFRAI